MSTSLAGRIPAAYAPGPEELAGRIILVTGATGGLGGAAAAAMAGCGAELVLLGRNVSRLEALCDAIERGGRGRAAIYPMNLAGAGPDHYEELAARLAAEYGRLDGVLHAAAAFGGLSPIANYPLERWAEVLQVNLNAAFLLARACLPVLGRAADPVLAFAGDAWDAGRGSAYWGAYRVSKAAVAALARILGEELECNSALRVLCLDPGPMRTALRALAYPAEPRGRAAAPADLSRALVFLFGPRGRGLGSGSFDLRPVAERAAARPAARRGRSGSGRPGP